MNLASINLAVSNCDLPNGPALWTISISNTAPSLYGDQKV